MENHLYSLFLSLIKKTHAKRKTRYLCLYGVVLPVPTLLSNTRWGGSVETSAEPWYSLANNLMPQHSCNRRWYWFVELAWSSESNSPLPHMNTQHAFPKLSYTFDHVMSSCSSVAYLYTSDIMHKHHRLNPITFLRRVMRHQLPYFTHNYVYNRAPLRTAFNEQLKLCALQVILR